MIIMKKRFLDWYRDPIVNTGIWGCLEVLIFFPLLLQNSPLAIKGMTVVVLLLSLAELLLAPYQQAKYQALRGMVMILASVLDFILFVYVMMQ